MQSDEMTGTVMEGVAEYGEGLDVTLQRDRVGRDWIGGDRHRGETRWTIHAQNEGGHNSTSVDLLDLITWLREHRPDLLEAPEPPPPEQRFTLPHSYRCAVCRTRLKASTSGPHMRIWCAADANHQALNDATWQRLREDLVSGLVVADLDDYPSGACT